MTVDTLGEAGIYFCMTGGQVYVVTDSGDTWAPIARDLPAVLTVEEIMVPVTVPSPAGGTASLARGRTFLITGGNTGIGLATAAALARDGGRLYIASPNPDRGQAAVTAIKSAASHASVGLLPLHLPPLASAPHSP